MTGRAEIAAWFDRGRVDGATHMIVVVDGFSHDDYPVYVNPGDDFWKIHARYEGCNMQRIMEVYDLGADRNTQLGEFRANHPTQGATTTGEAT